VLDADRGTFDGQHVRFLKRLDVHEACPVMLGAGVDTMTEAIKGRAALIDRAAGLREFVKYQRTLARINGVKVPGTW